MRSVLRFAEIGQTIVVEAHITVRKQTFKMGASSQSIAKTQEEATRTSDVDRHVRRARDQDQKNADKLISYVAHVCDQITHDLQHNQRVHFARIQQDVCMSAVRLTAVYKMPEKIRSIGSVLVGAAPSAPASW